MLDVTKRHFSLYLSVGVIESLDIHLIAEMVSKKKNFSKLGINYKEERLESKHNNRETLVI